MRARGIRSDRGDDAGLHVQMNFDPADDIAAPQSPRVRPQVAILREQGVNGQLEMAAAFDRAGFAAVDVHMSDIIEECRAGEFPRSCRLRRFFLRRRARRR